jgi:DNA (cytosine-5)-methyltransferase 1
MTMRKLRVLEICAGAGGQALGLEQAGFEHEALVEIDPDACDTLRANRPSWKVIEGDIRDLDGTQFDGVDLLAGGVPCQPFSVGGQQLGAGDERDLFPEALRLIGQARPRVVLLENVPGLTQKRFTGYRAQVIMRLHQMGYRDILWRVVSAQVYGVPQLRPRFVLLAMRGSPVLFDHQEGSVLTVERASRLSWPLSLPGPHALARSVGMTLYDLMAANGWPGAYEWASRANNIAPTIVGGSKKHGGADLGPTRAKAAWERLGVNGKGVADEAPGPDFPEHGLPKLTVRMVARIQGFPDEWEITGRKTAAYRQVGNAFPPPVAQAFGIAIRRALNMEGLRNAH